MKLKKMEERLREYRSDLTHMKTEDSRMRVIVVINNLTDAIRDHKRAVAKEAKADRIKNIQTKARTHDDNVVYILYSYAYGDDKEILGVYKREIDAEMALENKPTNDHKYLEIDRQRLK